MTEIKETSEEGIDIVLPRFLHGRRNQKGMTRISTM